MRVRRRLSLDDVEQLTRETGVRVTRSHLSRVETGCADIAVPRLLCLLRVDNDPDSRGPSRRVHVIAGGTTASSPSTAAADSIPTMR